jgi:guanylate kinase
MSFILTLTGPSGVGKGYVKSSLKSDFDYDEPLIYTTRPSRPHEGDRICLEGSCFDLMVGSGKIVLPHDVYGNRYGFERGFFDSIEDTSVVSEVYVSLVSFFREKYPDAIMVALKSNSEQLLRERLKKRGESSDSIEKRVRSALEESRSIDVLRDNFDLVLDVGHYSGCQIVDIIGGVLKNGSR